MVSKIRVAYWIECYKCKQESVVVATHPETRRLPTTKVEAWEAAVASGWSGMPNRPRCPDCTH